MKICGDSTTAVRPVPPEDGGSIPTSPLHTINAHELVVRPAELAEIRKFVETHHYSRSVNGVKIAQCFAVLHGGALVGAVIFGQLSTTAWKRFGETEAEVLELRRLVLLDAAGRNSESRVVGYCLRWIKRHMPVVSVVVSYADPAYGHLGTIYRASNFKYDGLTPNDKGFYDPTTGRTYHSRALRTKYKGKFKPFVVALREKLARGVLQLTTLPGKHRYVFTLRGCS